MNELILNSSTTFLQKVMLIGVGLITFITGGLTVLGVIFYFLGLIEYSEFGMADVFMLFLFFLSFLFFSIALFKDGLIIENKEVYKSFFLFRKKLMVNKIELSDVCDVCVLQFNMARKVALWTTPNPDQTVGYTEFRVYGLNANHSKRTLIYAATSKEQSQRIVDAMVKEIGLTRAAYTPPRSNNRRR